MARSRKMTRSKAPRDRKDWVYTGQGYESSGFTFGSGPASAVARYIVHGNNTGSIIRQGVGGVVVAGVPLLGAPELPERGTNRVYRIEGQVAFEPTSWAIGNSAMWGWRLLHYEQDPEFGAMTTDLEYSMFVNGAGSTPRNWANQGFLQERHDMKIFGETGTAWVHNIRWSSRKGLRLPATNGIFLYMEANTGSVGMRGRCWLRALVSAN